jgi:4-alpha-glucanotransferase
MKEPLFDWLNKRSAGVLLHPTSLPDSTGIGTLGAGAYRFVDVLTNLGFEYWQMCPLGPTGYGDSPYQCFSAFAGNPYLIDLHQLVYDGLLKDSELQVFRDLPHGRVDYGAQWQRRWPILRLAYERHETHPVHAAEFEKFKETAGNWLESYCLFATLKARHNGAAWSTWPKAEKDYKQARKLLQDSQIQRECDMQAFFQFLFFNQWSKLRAYAHSHKLQIIGDIPIFVAMDSADVWAEPQWFQLNDALEPTAVAGVPPDYFAVDGQLWGNPLFDWKALKKDNYGWWIRRLEATFSLYDVVRIDHFRGFDEYWEVPATAKTARDGKWQPGPGLDFFKKVKKHFPNANLIAEDLGLITDGVRQLLAETGLPGMAVLQFAFDGENSDYLPHNLMRNNVLYPGTHDNNTCWGWYSDQSEQTCDLMRRYWRVNGETVPWDFIRAGYASVSRLFVVSMQDLMSLGPEARMNTPGTAQGNWQWRCTIPQLEALERDSGDYLRELKTLYNR